MNNFFKTLLTILCCFLTLSLAACGNNETGDNETKPPVNSETNNNLEETPTASGTDTTTEENSKTLIVNAEPDIVDWLKGLGYEE